MGIAVNLPSKMEPYLKAPYDAFVKETLAVELYREGEITLRQAAEMLGTSYSGIMEILDKRKTYVNYGKEELEEDIAYGCGE